MSQIEQEIFKSIQTIAKRLISRAGYDKTIIGVVTQVPEVQLTGDEYSDYDEYDDETMQEQYIEPDGVYMVKQGNANYQAKYNGKQPLAIGDVVFVLIPQNDFANTKYILGKV